MCSKLISVFRFFTEHFSFRSSKIEIMKIMNKEINMLLKLDNFITYDAEIQNLSIVRVSTVKHVKIKSGLQIIL